MNTRLVRTLALLAAALAGCDDAPPADADADADADMEGDADADSDADEETDAETDGDAWPIEPPAEPAPPQPAELPRLQSWVCPDGWSPVAHESLTDETGAPFSWCEPPPVPRLRSGDYVTPLEEGEAEGDRPICDPAVDGTYPVVGFADCQPLGDPCPSGTFPEIPADVTGARIYVLAGAGGGDGSEAAPLGTIGQAVAAAAAGDVIVIGAGTYEETLSIDQDLTIWGRCVRDTSLHASGIGSGPVFVASGASTRIRNVRLGGDAAALSSLGDVALEGVWVHGVDGTGVLAQGGSLVLSGSLVDSVDSSISEQGIGLVATRSSDTAADVTIRSSSFEQTRGGVHASNGGTVRLEDVLVRNTRASFDGEEFRGFGLSTSSEATVTAARLLLHRTHFRGIAFGTSSLDAEDLVIRRTEGLADVEVAPCAVWAAAGELRITRGLLDDNEGLGFYAQPVVPGLAVSSELQDVVVRGTHAAPGTLAVESQGLGISTTDARTTLRRCLIEGSQTGGINLIAPAPAGASTLEDVRVRDTRPSVFGEAGFGLFLGGGTSAASATLTRIALERNSAYGLSIEALVEGSTVDIQDLTVLDTAAGPADRSGGLGLYVLESPGVTVTRALISGTAGHAVVAERAAVELSDITVRDTFDPGPADTASGLHANNGSITLRRGIVEDTDGGTAVSAAGASASLDLSDLAIRRTTPDPDDQYGGYGFAVGQGTQAKLARVRVEDSVVVGVSAVEPGTTVTAEDIWVERTTPLGGDGLAFGIGVDLGAVMEVHRAVVSDSTGIAYEAYAAGSTLTLEDVVARDMRPSEVAGFFAAGLGVEEGATATVTHAAFERSPDFGVFANAATLSLTDVLISETASTALDGRFGRGVNIQGGGEVTLTGCQLLGNADVGLAAFDQGTTVSLSNVLIADTAERACAALGESDPNACIAGRGYGLGVYDGAAATVDDVEVWSNAALGVQLAEGGTVTGSGLRLRDNPVGANLQGLPESYDFEAALEDFTIEGSETELDTSEMSIPEPHAL